MRWLWPTLTATMVADALQLRGRVEAITVLEPADAPPAPGYRVVTAAGVTVDDATFRAAVAHAQAEGLAVLDLVPHDVPAEILLDMLRTLNPKTYRGDALVKGYGALTAIVVDDDVAARARLHQFEGLTPVEMAELSARLKGYAPRATDLAIAPGLLAGPPPAGTRASILQRNVGRSMALTGLAVDFALFAYAARTRKAGAIAAAVTRALQPVLATGGTAVEPRDMPGRVALRAVSSAVGLPAVLASRPAARAAADEVEAKREEYDKLLADGLDRFYEERRPDCPRLLVDRPPRAPGAGRPHPVQAGRVHAGGVRPRAATSSRTPGSRLEGLDFYYKDFYDGLAEDAAEGIFVNIGDLYRARADMVRPYRTPTRWLDVGGGHGHFCLTAKDVWPDATFDVLDISETIEEAERMRVGRPRPPRLVHREGARAGRPVRRHQHEPLPRAHPRPRAPRSTPCARCCRSAAYTWSRCPTPSRSTARCSASTGSRGSSRSTSTSCRPATSRSCSPPGASRRSRSSGPRCTSRSTSRRPPAST